jgi:hypothetical protein
LAKKSNSSACCPIFACSAFTSIAGSRRSPSAPTTSAACATSWPRHSVIWFGWTSKRWARLGERRVAFERGQGHFRLERW